MSSLYGSEREGGQPLPIGVSVVFFWFVPVVCIVSAQLAGREREAWVSFYSITCCWMENVPCFCVCVMVEDISMTGTDVPPPCALYVGGKLI